jgi:hypothetical protein
MVEHVTALRSQAANEPSPSESKLDLGCEYQLNAGIDNGTRRSAT